MGRPAVHSQTTVGGGAPTIVIPATAGIQQRESTAAGQRSFPSTAGTTAGWGGRWVPVTNDGNEAAHPQSRRESHGHTIVIPTTAGIHGPTIVIPATAGIHGGGPAMGSRLHGNDDGAAGGALTNDGGRRRTHNRHSRNSGNPRPHNRHSRDGGNPRRRAGDGFPSPRERRWGGRRRTHKRRWAAAHPQSSFPQQRESTAPQSSFPRRRESKAEGRRWVPVSTGTTIRNVGKAAATMLN